MTQTVRNLLPLLLELAALCNGALSVATAGRKQQQRLRNNIRSPHRVAAAEQNPTSAFCKAFNTQCYAQALQGKQGEVQVVCACRRNGKKYSRSYSFGCKADGVDITQDVLNHVGAKFSVTATSTQTTTAPTPTVTTVASTSTSVATSFTSTSTQVTFGTNDEVPFVIVAVPTSSKRRKRADVIDPTQFCSAFGSGCTTKCARVGSTPKHTLCQAGTQTAGALQYRLACNCKNGKMETQHVLKGAAGTTSFSTVATSTSIYTSTPNAATVLATATTTTMSVSSTTRIALAATGKVDTAKIDDGTVIDYLTQGQRYVQYGACNSATSFVAFRDPASAATLPLYQLQLADDSARVILGNVGYSDKGRIETGHSHYIEYSTGPPSSCSAAGSHASQAAGASGECETFVFGAQADATTLTASSPSLNLTMQYIQPGDGSTPTQLYWMHYNYPLLESTLDPVAYSADYGRTAIIQLRFRA